MRVVVMGVCGCGKSAVGARLAQALRLPYVEGDTLHPPANVERMARGVPLTDADRAGWLEAVAGVLAAAGAASATDEGGPRGVVVSCSALRRRYRDRLRAAAPDLRLLHLHGERALLETRLRERQGHYMPASLLQSQLDTLEPPQADEACVTLDIAQPLATLVAQAAQALHACDGDPPEPCITAALRPPPT